MTTIKIERARLKITQLSLAKNTGLSLLTINKIENQKSDVTIKTARKIANYFGLQINDFEEFK